MQDEWGRRCNLGLRSPGPCAMYGFQLCHVIDNGLRQVSPARGVLPCRNSRRRIPVAAGIWRIGHRLNGKIATAVNTNENNATRLFLPGGKPAQIEPQDWPEQGPDKGVVSKVTRLNHGSDYRPGSDGVG